MAWENLHTLCLTPALLLFFFYLLGIKIFVIVYFNDLRIYRFLVLLKHLGEISNIINHAHVYDKKFILTVQLNPDMIDNF